MSTSGGRLIVLVKTITKTKDTVLNISKIQRSVWLHVNCIDKKTTKNVPLMCRQRRLPRSALECNDITPTEKELTNDIRFRFICGVPCKQPVSYTCFNSF